MDPFVREWLDALTRWLHVVAGVVWLGHLYFFNFVNAHVAKTYDADTKKKVVPELMPRALYFFRWGALYTWVTGIVLLGLVYHMGFGMMEREGGPLAKGPAIGIAFTLVLLLFFVYDGLWRSPLAKNEQVGAAVSFVLLVALAFGFAQFLTGRAAFIHLGMTMGTIMMMNVWMRIWPAQRKIIAGIKGTAAAPGPEVPALAALRSKHNTYLSVPLLFFMVSQHFPTAFSHQLNWVFAAGFIAVGWAMAKFLFMKSASDAPKAKP